MDRTGAVDVRADSWTGGGQAALDCGLYMRERALMLPESDPYRDALLDSAALWVDCAALRGVLPQCVFR